MSEGRVQPRDWDVERLLDWANIAPGERSETAALLARTQADDVAPQLEFLNSILGMPGYHLPPRAGAGSVDVASGIAGDADVAEGAGIAEESEEKSRAELTWLAALLWHIPALIEWYNARDIPEDVQRASVADIGQHVSLSRRATGSFGLETWWWLLQLASGSLFRLGRLQFQLQKSDLEVLGADFSGFVVGIHIPEDGALAPELVDASLAQAADFFERFWYTRVEFGICTSWLLDPYLSVHLDAAGARPSNIVAFANRFQLVGEPADAPDSALYFTFGTRDLSRVGDLPRTSRLQRVVLERIERGGVWQSATGYLRLGQFGSLAQ